MSSTTFSGRTAIVGIGATEFSKNSGRTELHLAVEATLKALADAGIDPAEVDGFSTFTLDKVPDYEVARLIGARQLRFFPRFRTAAVVPAAPSCTLPWLSLRG